MSHALVYLPGPDGWRERIVPAQVLSDVRRVDCGPGTDGSGRRIEMRTVMALAGGQAVHVAVERLGTPNELAPVLALMQPPRRREPARGQTLNCEHKAASKRRGEAAS